MTVSLSVIILTYNEERNVSFAVGSVVKWASRVFVVDSGSTDRTVEIANSYEGVEVIEHPFEDYGRQWNWTLSALPVETEWVMKLDADERVPSGTRREIETALEKAGSKIAGFTLWRKLVFMGKWLKHTSGRVHDVRIWRWGRGYFEDRSVNEHLILDGEVKKLKSPLIHEDRKGLSAWVWRHNRYSTLEAAEYVCGSEKQDRKVSGRQVAFRRFLKERIWPWIPCKPTVYFFYLYLFRLGFLDGRPGYEYARLRQFYYYLIELKKREYHLLGTIYSPDEML